MHFWQKERGVLRSIAVTFGWNGHRMSQTADSGEENSPAAPVGYRTRDLPITSQALYQLISYYIITTTTIIIIIIIITIIIIYPLTARVVGAPQMISQPVSSIFP